MRIKPLPRSHIIFWLLDMSNKQEKKITAENYTTIEMINSKTYHKIQTYACKFLLDRDDLLSRKMQIRQLYVLNLFLDDIFLVKRR